MESKFNLIDEPWIQCLMLNENETKELSLFEVLSQAQEIKEITDNSPLVVVSLHRLLLAILHRNFGPKNFDAWKELWKKGRWDAEKLKSYFDKYKDRFNLFDDERPFYQYPLINSSKSGEEAKIKPTEYLIEEKASGNNATLFDHSFEIHSENLSASVAVRYLIARQSFSFSGTGCNYPFGFANSILISGFSVLATGRNLFETLALNLVIYYRDKPIPVQDDDEDLFDLPFWEREELVQATEKDKDGTLPLGYLDYLTWQSRRIKLIRDEENQAVKNCQLQQNFKLKEVVPIFDPFKVYVKGDNGFYPLNLREDKSLWRSSHTILQQATSIDNRSSLFSHLSKVQSMIANGEIKGLRNHAFSIFGVINDKANVKSWTHEKLPLPLVYLNDNELLNNLEMAINFAEEISGVLRFAVKVLAEQLESDANSFPAMSVYWSVLENRFQELLSDLPKDKESAMRGWFAFVDKTAKNAFDKTANSLSGSANEQKAIVEAESAFYKTRAKLLNKTSEYRQYLPNYKTKGGTNE